MRLYYILLLAGVVFLLGCVQPECTTKDDCLEKTCMNVICSKGECVYSNMTNCCGNDVCEVNEAYSNCPTDCPNCDDYDECTEDFYEYHELKCVNNPLIPCCGNDECEEGEENYTTCSKDCPDCNDSDACTNDYFNYTTQLCVNELLIPCCGNNECESGESHDVCSIDCPLDDDGYIELMIGYINSPDIGARYQYLIKNCLSNNITTVRLKGYWNGTMEGEITKAWLEQFDEGYSEYRFLHVSPRTCIESQSLIKEAWVDRTVGQEYNISAYYKFEYEGQDIEFTSDEGTCTIIANDWEATLDDLAIFTIDNTNVKVVP